MRQEERSYLNRSLFPEKGEDFIIYIDIQNDLKYRWSLDRYVLISTSLQKSIADKGMVSYIIKKDSAITSFELKDNKYLILTYTDNEGKEQSINIDLSVVVADNYVDLISNQDIGGIKTFTEKTLFKKDINVSGDGIFGGEVVAIVGDGTPIGVTDYSALTGKPSINGKELISGENTLIELGIQPAGNYALQDNLTTHTEDNIRHISEKEREAWNNKWDYNEETIKNLLINNYVDLINNQDIGGIKTFIDKTIFKKDINVVGDAVVGGEVAAIVGEGTPVGVTDYSALTGKPAINGKELVSGNNTLAELGIQPAGDYITESLVDTKLDNYTTKTFVANNYAGKSALNNHIADNVKHITADERTAWNNKSDLTAEDVKKIKVNNAGHADSADNATKAGSADKLTNYRKIFGLPFDGTKDVDGGITANGDSVINGNLNVTKDGIFGGEVVAIVGNAEPAGVTNYAQLQGKPSINGKELASGENTLDELGIQPKGDYTTASQLATTLADYATKVFVSNNYASKSVVNAIQALIPATATADNQLADKDFVNSSIATATAEFRGSFTSLDELKATSGNLNDYAFYLHTDDVGNKVVDRYKWTPAGWLYEYTLNNSSFTAEQWAALNSAITATLVQSYNSHLNNTTIHITAEERTKWNNKWDYNEETIKEVKVNAAVLSDKATKLQDDTAFTAWGQTFFENGKPKNVSGDLNVGISKLYWNWDSANYYMSCGGTEQMTYNMYGGHIFRAGEAERLRITKDGNVLIGTTTDNGYKLNVNGKGHYSGDLIVDGEVVAVAGEGTPAGVTDYSALTGKPSINGVTLVSGNNTLASLGIQAAGDYVTNSGVTTLLANYADKTFVSNNYVGKSAFNNHTADSDIHITSEERVTWNAKWDYNEATIKAVKVTSASSADSVAWSGITGKPTTFTPSAHTHTASDVSGLPTSLKNPYALTFGSKSYDGSAAATITASDLGALTAHQSIYALTLQVNSVSQGTYNPASAAKTINIAVPTKTSDITNDSGFITSAAIPTALKNPYAVEIKANGVSLGTYDGSAAATFNLSAANVGAANKVHSHNASEISGLPTNLSAFNNDVGFITGITKPMVEGVLTGDITSHTHSYLPLSGGTLYKSNNNTPLVIKGIKEGAWIAYKDSDSEFLGSIGVQSDKKAYFYYTSLGVAELLHSSNFNSYAPTLTGTGASGTWDISISGNAASATKLQDNTAFTAWGQTFFENGKPKNVSGDLNLGVSKLYWNWDSANYYMSCGGTEQMTYYMYGGHIFRAGGAERLRITKDGNVLIGTATDNGYKLAVNGSERVYGDLIVDGEVSALVA